MPAICAHFRDGGVTRFSHFYTTPNLNIYSVGRIGQLCQKEWTNVGILTVPPAVAIATVRFRLSNKTTRRKRKKKPKHIHRSEWTGMTEIMQSPFNENVITIAMQVDVFDVEIHHESV